MTTRTKIGTTIRKLRKNNGWTLRELAERSGLSVSSLSKAERDQQALTFDKLLQLAHGLQVDASAILDATLSSRKTNTTNRRSISRINDGSVVETENYRYTYLCTDLLKKKFFPIVAEIRARSLEEFGELVKHSGEEFSFVLEGAVEVHTEHYAPVILQTGESIFIDSNMGHAYLTHGSGPCRLLSICSAPEPTSISPRTEDIDLEKNAKQSYNNNDSL